MSAAINAHERKVALGLELADGRLVALLCGHGEILHRGLGKVRVAIPLQGLGPRLVAQPVADEVCVASVDQHGNFGENVWDKTVERLHPVAVEEEVAVDVHVAGIIRRDFRTERLHDRLLVEILADAAELAVAQVAIFTRDADVIWVLSGPLVRADDGVVAVDRGGDANPGTLAVVTGFNHGEAARESRVHGGAALLVEDGGVATVTTGHGAVVRVLS